MNENLMREIDALSLEELQALKEVVCEKLDGFSKEIVIELEYNHYKGSGKCWVARVNPTTKKILGFVEAESNIKTDNYRGRKVYKLKENVHYLFCETGSKSQDNRAYVIFKNDERESF